jgi:hypothetical protein
VSRRQQRRQRPRRQRARQHTECPRDSWAREKQLLDQTFGFPDDWPASEEEADLLNSFEFHLGGLLDITYAARLVCGDDPADREPLRPLLRVLIRFNRTTRWLVYGWPLTEAERSWVTTAVALIERYDEAMTASLARAAAWARAALNGLRLPAQEPRRVVPSGPVPEPPCPPTHPTRPVIADNACQLCGGPEIVEGRCTCCGSRYYVAAMT